MFLTWARERSAPIQLGEMVVEALRNVDPVAYVRFASVYRQFEDVGQFKDIVRRLEIKGRKREL